MEPVQRKRVQHFPTQKISIFKNYSCFIIYIILLLFYFLYFNKAEVSCSWKNENGSEIEEKLENHLEVIFRPREITLEKSGDLVTCSVVASRKDLGLVASLSIDENYLMPVNLENTDESLKVPGKAIFNLTQAYTAEALKNVEFSG